MIKEQQDMMRIGDLAELTDTTPQTIRYYEQLGLLSPTRREGRGHRHYNHEAAERLRKVAALKELGLSLEEIAEVIDLYFEDDTGLKGKRRVLEILQGHLQETEARLTSLQRFRDELTESIARLEELIRVAEKETEAFETQ